MNILQQIAKLLGGKLTKVHEKTVANKEAIEAEVRRAQASETLLDTNIKNETKRAQDEETRIELKAVDLVNAEETRATKSESDLSTKIDTDVKAEADRAKGAEQAIIGNLNAETARAKAAEKANSDAIISLDEKKVDKVEGKQLSTEDYTTAEKTKLSNVGYYIVQFSPYNTGEQPEVIFTGRDPSTGVASSKTWKLPFASDAIGGIIHPSQKLVLDNLISGDSALSILGTPSQTWQLNLGSGPKLKNSGGVFELRNAADNAYADLTVNALTIKGNVTQEGGSFITQAETVSAKDNTILLNSGETGAGVTKGEAGVEIDRGTLPKYKFIFDESDDRFKVGSEGDLWSVMLRDNESDLTNGGILTWDSTTKRAKTAFNIDDLANTYLPLAGGNMSGTIHIAPISTDGEIYNGIQALPGTWKDNALLTYDAEVVDIGSTDASLNLWATEITLNTMTGGSISLVTKTGGNLYHRIIRKDYIIYDEHNLDISQFVKPADLGNYLPLSAGVDKPLSDRLYFTTTAPDGDTYSIGNGEVTGNEGDSMVSIRWGSLGSFAFATNVSKTISFGTLICKSGIVSDDWDITLYKKYKSGTSTVSPKLKFGQADPANIFSEIWGHTFQGLTLNTYMREGSDGGEILLQTGKLHRYDLTANKKYKIYDESNLDISTFALKTDLDNIDLSGYLPLSGGTMTSALKFTPMGSIAFLNTDNSIRALLGYGNLPTGKLGLILKATLENNIIAFNTPGDLFHQKGSSEYKIWTEGNDGAGSGLDADLLDGKQGSEYALASNLSSYLPLSAGSSKSLTGALYVQGAVNNGPNGFSIGAVVGNLNSVTSRGIETAVYGTSFGMGADSSSNAGYFWIGGNSASEKSYFATVSKTSRVMDFLNRPTFGGAGLAKLSEIPTSIPANGGNADSVGNTNLKIYPYSSNEINFGGAGTPTDIYFGYRTMDGRPIPTSYRFGSTSNGTATLYAANFILAGKQVATTDQIPSIPSLSGGAGATSGQYVSGITVSGHAVTVTKASLPTSLPANGGYASELRGSYYTSGGPEKPPFFNKVGLFLRMLGSGNLGVTNTYMDTLVINTYINDVPWCNALAFAKDGTARGWIVAQNPNNSDWGTKKQIVTSDMLPTSLPASDVYAWAKASSKPSYAWSEITGKPTIPSLSGYATQSWVQSQGYLTSHQSLANYVTLNTAQTISGAKTFTSFVTCSAGAGTSSDIRLKKYINRMFDAEELLSNLSGYRYVMKETDMHYAGLVAQEVQEVLPEAVREDENGFLTVDTYPIIAALVEANKAKDNRIKALEDRITALEKKMSMVLNKIK